MRRALASLCLITLAACTGELPEADALPDALSESSGSVQIRLSGTDASGRQYRLQKATFELSGTAMLTLSTAQSPRAKSLTTPLPSGAYQLFLRPGYEVVELRSDGGERTIAAKLKSARPVHVSVATRTEQRVALCFSASDRDISFGAGTDSPECQVGAGPLAQAR